MSGPAKTSNKEMVAYELFGDKHTLSILTILSQHEERYCEIMETIKLNPVTLSNRLKKLENAGLITRTKGVKNKLSVTYSLTELGKRAQPALDSIREFGAHIKTERNN